MGEKIILAEEYKFLKKCFESKIGHSIKTESDCKKVIELLFSNEYSMMKTLKRVFGLASHDKPYRDTTLHNLSRAVGFDDWDDFLVHLPKMILAEDNFGVLFNPDDIVVSKLKINQVITIGWKPAYYIQAQYLGNFIFKVLEGNLQKMKKGHEFSAKKFILDYSPCSNLDCDPIREGYPLFPKIYATMDENAENNIG